MERSQEEEVNAEYSTPLSPNCKLRNKMQSKQQRNSTQFRGQLKTPLEKEFQLYMGFSFSKKGQSILNRFRRSDKFLPLLSKVAKKMSQFQPPHLKVNKFFHVVENI